MVGLLESGYKAFSSYKNSIIASILFGLAYLALGVLAVIPILGAFIIAYLMPRLLNWYYNKAIEGESIKTDYSLTFKVWLVYYLILHIVFISVFLVAGWPIAVRLISHSVGGLFAGVGMISNLVVNFLIGVIVLAVIAIILQILFTYTLYGSVLGKVNEFKLYPQKSLRVFVIYIVWAILLGIISALLIKIPYVGSVLNFIYATFFMSPVLTLVIAYAIL